MRPRLHKEGLFGLVEESFLTQRGTLLYFSHLLKDSTEQTEQMEVVTSQTQRTLPRIQLPTFFGKYEE